MLKRILIGLLIVLGIALITVLALDTVFGWNRLGGPPKDVLGGAPGGEVGRDSG